MHLYYSRIMVSQQGVHSVNIISKYKCVDSSRIKAANQVSREFAKLYLDHHWREVDHGSAVVPVLHSALIQAGLGTRRIKSHFN